MSTTPEKIRKKCLNCGVVVRGPAQGFDSRVCCPKCQTFSGFTNPDHQAATSTNKKMSQRTKINIILIVAGAAVSIVVLVIALTSKNKNEIPVPPREANKTASRNIPRPKKHITQSKKNAPKTEFTLVGIRPLIPDGYRLKRYPLLLFIRVNKQPSRKELTTVCEKLIALQRKAALASAVSLQFYLPGTVIPGGYTAGSGVWAPNGRWRDAYTEQQAQTGDYSGYTLIIKIGNQQGKMAGAKIAAHIPLKKRKLIYRALPNEFAEWSQTAFQFRVTEDDLTAILLEGSKRRWPRAGEALNELHKDEMYFTKIKY